MDEKRKWVLYVWYPLWGFWWIWWFCEIVSNWLFDCVDNVCNMICIEFSLSWNWGLSNWSPWEVGKIAHGGICESPFSPRRQILAQARSPWDGGSRKLPVAQATKLSPRRQWEGAERRFLSPGRQKCRPSEKALNAMSDTKWSSPRRQKSRPSENPLFQKMHF